MATAYRQRAPYRVGAVFAVAAVAVVAGVAVGGLHHLVGEYVDLILVGAAVVGFAVGRLVALGVRRFRLAAPGVAAALAVVAALLVFATDLGLDYRAARAAQAEHEDSLRLIRVGVGSGTRAEDLLRAHQPLGAWDFVGRALGFGEGVDPEHGGRAASFGVGALVLLLLELVGAAGLAALIARGEALEPACPVCGRWRVEHALGAAAYGVAEPLARALGRGDLDAAAALLRPPDTREELRLARLACPSDHDEHGGVLRIYERKLDRRGRSRHLHRADLVASSAEIARLGEALTEAVAAPTVAGPPEEHA